MWQIYNSHFSDGGSNRRQASPYICEASTCDGLCVVVGSGLLLWRWWVGVVTSEVHLERRQESAKWARGPCEHHAEQSFQGIRQSTVGSSVGKPAHRDLMWHAKELDCILQATEGYPIFWADSWYSQFFVWRNHSGPAVWRMDLRRTRWEARGPIIRLLQYSRREFRRAMVLWTDERRHGRNVEGKFWQDSGSMWNSPRGTQIRLCSLSGCPCQSGTWECKAKPPGKVSVATYDGGEGR